MNSEIIAEDLKLQSLKEYCDSENRICPKDSHMSEISHILIENGVKTKGETTLPLPFYLPNWLGPIYILRVSIFQDYIDCGYKNGIIDKLDAYVRSLDENEWHHHGE
jgi:hypothetical protein